jgi:hypothetical protein
MFIPSVADNPIMLNVVILNAIMLSVGAPIIDQLAILGSWAAVVSLLFPSHAVQWKIVLYFAHCT